MSSEREKYGYVKLHLDEVIQKRGISLNKLYQRSETQEKQLKKYRDNTIQRCDLFVLSRLCSTLECSISDILEYIPADQVKKGEKED